MEIGSDFMMDTFRTAVYTETHAIASRVLRAEGRRETGVGAQEPGEAPVRDHRRLP